MFTLEVRALIILDKYNYIKAVIFNQRQFQPIQTVQTQHLIISKNQLNSPARHCQLILFNNSSSQHNGQKIVNRHFHENMLIAFDLINDPLLQLHIGGAKSIEFVLYAHLCIEI